LHHPQGCPDTKIEGERERERKSAEEEGSKKEKRAY